MGRVPGGSRAQAGLSDMYRKFVMMFAAAVLATGTSACSSAAPQPSAQPSAPATSPTRRASTARPAALHHAASRTGSVRVLAEPGAGIGAVYRLITGAHSTVNLTMYELADPTAEADWRPTPPAGSTCG